jgi:nucleotide-binding universal stress UspA family protein
MSAPRAGVSTTPAGPRANLAGREVVVGFDGGEPARAAVRWAAREAARLGSPLTIVYAANVPAVTAWSPGTAVVLDGLGDVSERVAAEGAALAREVAPDLRVRSLGMIGGPAGELIGRSGEAGLVVVGRRRRSALASAALGSVSFAVILHARCPVVVVQEGTEDAAAAPGGPVVVGVDGSRAAQAALELAAELADAWGSALSVVAAWAVPASEPWTEALGPEAAQAAHDDARRGAEEVAVAALDRVRAAHPGTEVSVSVVQGPAEEVLAEASRSASLVVVGSRGHGGFAGMMLGSVGHSVLRKASSPVAVVRWGAW